MAKNLVRAYEGARFDEYLNDMYKEEMDSKYSKKVGGRVDSKRTRESYISSAKKGAASRAAKAARKSATTEYRGRHEVTEMADLQDEICGRPNFKRNDRKGGNNFKKYRR